MSPTNGVMLKLLTNKYVLIALAIGLIIFAVFGLPILVSMPHIIIAAAFIILGITFIAIPSILPAHLLYKIIIGLIFFTLALLVYFEPSWFGVDVPNMIGGLI